MIEGVDLISPSLMGVVPQSAIQTVLISAALSGVSAVVTRTIAGVLSVFLMQNEKGIGQTNILHSTVLYYNVIYCTVLYRIILYYTVLYVLYCTVLYCIVLHC